MLWKNVNFILHIDKTIGITGIIPLNQADCTCYQTIFLTSVPANKMLQFGTYYYALYDIIAWFWLDWVSSDWHSLIIIQNLMS